MQIIALETDDGPVLFETSEPTRAGGVRPAGAGVTSGTPLAEGRLDDALKTAKRMAKALKQVFDDMEFTDAEATVAFKVSAEGGFIVAKSAAEASVSLTFKLGRAKVG